MVHRFIFFPCIIFMVTLVSIYASLYDPHKFPNDGPFFEGWYMRVSGLESDDSFGLLFGSVLPEPDVNAPGPLVVASILLRRCTADAGKDCTLFSVDGEFTKNDLDIKVKGEPVQNNPDVSTPPDFKWRVNNGKHGGLFKQTGEKTVFNFNLGNITLRGEAKNPTYWDNYGTGPEGWLVNLPLPLHWYVYSLRSEIIYYEIQNLTSGAVIRGTTGNVHLEKNWGESFPRKWIWSEGVSLGNDNSSFAITGGLVDFPFISVDAYLIGYRNPTKNIHLDFRPDNSIISAQIDGCTGSVNVTANSLLYKFEINLMTSIDSLSSCLLGPETRGFVHACVESYDATASVRIFKRSLFPFGEIPIEEKVYEKIALEFGGLSVCDNKCSET